VTRGHPLPLGATPIPGGINFALICRHATSIRLVLSEPRDSGTLAEIALDPRRNRTGDHWHIRVDGLAGEFGYGYRVDGPHGGDHRYDPSLVLLDPASHALSGGPAWGRRGDGPRRGDRDLYIAMNAWQEPLVFHIPAAPSGRHWRRAVDTALSTPEDALGLDEGPLIPVFQPYRFEARSLPVLIS
jgi:pullulanase/glycogen debranching enzyme